MKLPSKTTSRPARPTVACSLIFYGFEPILWNVAERGIPVRVFSDYKKKSVLRGAPTDVHCMPVGFHRRVSLEVGLEPPEISDIGLLVVGPETPQDVVRNLLPGMVEGGIIVYRGENPPRLTRRASAVIQCGDLIGAQLCPSS